MKQEFNCQCGKVRGFLHATTPRQVNRGKCYCGYCQRYAERLGKAHLVVDPIGGTDMVQVSPAQVKITQGCEHIACVRQTDKGALRLYSTCCGTPLCNTVSNPKVPFLSLFVANFSGLTTEPERVEAFGEIGLHTFVPIDQKANITHLNTWRQMKGMLHFVRLLFSWWRRGHAQPSPIRQTNGVLKWPIQRVKSDEVIWPMLKPRSAAG